MTMYFPEQTEYQEACQKMWQYIDKEVIDHQYGGWYYYGLDESPENKKDRKAQQWKGAYHDGRAMMQVLEYY